MKFFILFSETIHCRITWVRVTRGARFVVKCVPVSVSVIYDPHSHWNCGPKQTVAPITPWGETPDQRDSHTPSPLFLHLWYFGSLIPIVFCSFITVLPNSLFLFLIFHMLYTFSSDEDFFPIDPWYLTDCMVMSAVAPKIIWTLKPQLNFIYMNEIHLFEVWIKCWDTKTTVYMYSIYCGPLI